MQRDISIIDISVQNRGGQYALVNGNGMFTNPNRKGQNGAILCELWHVLWHVLWHDLSIFSRG